MSPTTPYNQPRPHPWHGLPVGDDAPDVVNVYIEMNPTDGVKYEIDKETGYLIVDRPRKFSSQLPTAYGFIPQTYCGDRVGGLSDSVEEGDQDPLDICVISECALERNEVLLTARIVGGLHMVDGGEADDKIIAVLEGDYVWGEARDIDDIPKAMITRLHHYFLTYKEVPGESQKEVAIDDIYGAAHAKRVLQASIDDYNDLMTLRRENR